MTSEQSEPLLNLAPPEVEPETRNRKSTYHGLNLAEHNSKYGRMTEDSVGRQNACRAFTAKCTAQNFLKWIVDKVPAINIFRTYKLKQYIMGDIIAGLSVAVVTIPQSLGYARLAGVPPILGLYTSFFPVLVYFIFGSSRHVSMGTMALCSLIIAETVKKESQRSFFSIGDNATVESDGSFTREELGQISVAVSISFLAGILQIVMGIFHLGLIVSYMAEPFVSGYLCATNIRVLTHQIQDMLGLPYFKGYTGPGDYFYSVYGILINLPSVNLIQVLISILSLATLVLVKKCINERFSSKLKVPIPIDIIIVVIFTLASHFGHLEQKFNVKILKTIPKGMPTVMLPSADHMKNYAFDAFMLAIVAYMMVGMMAKLFSQRHNYAVDNNQELLANGLSCVGGAFFCSLAGSTSPPRCFLMETTGGKTQVAYLISAVLTLLTMLLIAPLFQSLPICVLSCIIFVACIPLFPHYVAWLDYWRTNKYDFAVWVFTVVTNLIVSVDIGLLIGMGFSLILVHFQMQRPQKVKLYVNKEDEICLDQKRYSNCQPVEDAVIFHFESPLYFATLDVFKEQLFSSTVSLSFLKSKAASVNGRVVVGAEVVVDAGDMPLQVVTTGGNVDEIIQNETNHLERKQSSDNCKDNIIDVVSNQVDVKEVVKNEKSNEGNQVKLDKPVPHNIIVDCSAIPFLDTSGAKLLAQLHSEYSKFDIRFLLANCCNNVIQQLKAVDLCKTLVMGSVYPSIQDALFALNL